MDEPIDTYSERARGILRRDSTLFPGKVAIRGHQFGRTKYETHVPLGSLEPDIGTALWRSRQFFRGVGQVAGMAVGVWALIVPLGYPVDSLSVIITGSLTGAWAVWTAMHFPAHKVYRFVNTSGVTVLDMVAAGPEREHCELFAEQVSEAIRKARAAGSPPVRR